MGIFVALLIGWMVACIATAIDDDCCLEKEVGGVLYKLVDLDPAAIKSPFNCKNPCVYSSENGTRYCFAHGDLETECAVTSIPLGMDVEGTSTDNHQGGAIMMGGFVNGAFSSDNVDLVIGSCYIKTSPLIEGIQRAAAALGPENKPYLCGGSTSSQNAIKDCHYLEKDGRWEFGHTMNTDRYAFTMNRVGSHLVAVAGLDNSDVTLKTYELLPLEGNSTGWSQKSIYTLHTPIGHHCAVTISSSKLMIIGGTSDNGITKLRSVKILDVTTGNTIDGIDLPEGVYGHQCTVYDGRIWKTGGIMGGGTYSNYYSQAVHSLYLSEDSSNSKWIPRTPMTYGRSYHVAVVVGGLFKVISGNGGYTYEEALIHEKWAASFLEPRERRVWSAYTYYIC